jgi:predicted kinase
LQQRTATLSRLTARKAAASKTDTRRFRNDSRAGFAYAGNLCNPDQTPTMPIFTSPTLHFLCGKAGAGKTTVAKVLAQERAAILISEDVWLARLFGDQMKTFDDYVRCSKRLKTVVGPLATDLLTAGHSVVLDFPANTKAGRSWFRSIFESAGVSHVLHFVRTSDQTCLERIERRNDERPEGSHHLTAEDFTYISSLFEAPEPAEGFNVNVCGT